MRPLSRVMTWDLSTDGQSAQDSTELIVCKLFNYRDMEKEFGDFFVQRNQLRVSH
jgi:hypothetical protein